MQASLPLEMKESLRNISGMGFPSPRVARALKRCDGDDQKVNHSALSCHLFHFSSQQVFDFLLLMGEIVDKGYNGDSAEIALLYHEEKIDKVMLQIFVLHLVLLLYSLLNIWTKWSDTRWLLSDTWQGGKD